MNTLAVLAVLAVSLVTLAVGAVGFRISRTTSDFYVASRAVGPVLNASAISGEYLSAASFLGVAGLVLLRGVDMLWYPVGWTAGYLLLLVFVAAPLRRSRAYTLPDFAEFRVESLRARRVASALVVLIGLLYLVPQFQGAGLTLSALTGSPTWVGAMVVALVVLANVVSGGMRSITIAQAFQYWLKLVALLTPLIFLLRRWLDTGAVHANLDSRAWVEPMQGPHSTYLVYSLILATFLGTMGLPHVVVRFYTNRDGHAARRTTVTVLGMLSAFYLLPTMYGVLGRIYASDLIASGPHRLGRARAAAPDPRRARGRPAHRAARSRRLRGVPVHLVGAGRLGRRRARPGPAGPLVRRRPGLPHRRCPGRRRHPRPHPALLRDSRSRTRSSSPSPSPPPRSARCCCWASGGAG